MGPDTALSGARRAWADGESRLAHRDCAAAEKLFRDALAQTGHPAARQAESLEIAAGARVGLGRVHLSRAEFGRAAEEFHRARSLRPEAWSPLHWLGCTAAHQGEYESGEKYLTAALGCAPPRGRTLVQRAYVRVRMGKTDSALADLRAAAGHDGADDDARWVLAALSGGGDRQLALLLRRAALAELAHGAGSGGPDWQRTASLLAAAWQLVPEPSRFTPLYAVALSLGGRRDAAVRMLGEATRRSPSAHRTTHTLALVLLNGLGARDRDTAHATWPQCLAAWAALLHDRRFWEQRRTEAERRYGTAVSPALVASLRDDLREHLERSLPPQDIGARIPPALLLRREADAARLLDRIGGFPLSGDAVVCGPLRIAELGRAREFGAFLAACDAPQDVADRLRHTFSQLGIAYGLLQRDRHAESLAAVADLRCAKCRRDQGGRGEPALCDPDCARFDDLNPAYAGLPDKHHRLSHDAVALALRARLGLGLQALTAAQPDLHAASENWRQAIVHSRALDRYQETQLTVVRMALGAAAALHRARDLSGALSVLQTARAITGANERHRLDGQLARVLADRGIWAANRDLERLEAPAEDLRRAVAFNPHLLRAQVNLGTALRLLAAQRRRAGSLSGARTTLQEAVYRLTEALTHFPGNAELQEQRDEAARSLDLLTEQFNASRGGNRDGG